MNQSLPIFTIDIPIQFFFLALWTKKKLKMNLYLIKKNVKKKTNKTRNCFHLKFYSEGVESFHSMGIKELEIYYKLLLLWHNFCIFGMRYEKKERTIRKYIMDQNRHNIIIRTHFHSFTHTHIHKDGIYCAFSRFWWQLKIAQTMAIAFSFSLSI